MVLLPMPLAQLPVLLPALSAEEALEAGISEAGGILGRLPDTGRHTQVSIVNKAQLVRFIGLRVFRGVCSVIFFTFFFARY